MTNPTPANVVVVGDQRLADILANSGAYWVVHNAAPSISLMWDSMEAQVLPSPPDVLIITDGTAQAPGELEGTLAEFTRFPQTTMFLFADPQRGPALAQAALQMAATKEGGNPNAPIYLLPMHDVNIALSMMQQVLGGTIPWGTPPAQQATPAPQTPTQPPPGYITPTDHYTQTPQTPQPDPYQQAIAQVEAGNVQYDAQPTSVYQQPETPAYQPDPATSLSADYPQASIYSEHVVEQASQRIAKLADARPGQMTIACMSSKGGSGKCLEANTLVYDPVTGTRNRIGQIVSEELKTQVTAFDGRFMSQREIGERFNNGIKPVLRVKLRSGREIVATDNHPLLTTDGWTELGNLSKGETIATPSRIPFPTEPVPMDAAELDLLALMLAEGGTSQVGTHFTNFEESIVEVAQAAAESLGMNFRADSGNNRKGQYIITRNLRMEDLPTWACGCGCRAEAELAQVAAGTAAVDAQQSRPRNPRREPTLRHFRRAHGLDFVLAKNKTMPKAVFRLSEDQLARFIALFWMCDGYAVTKGGGDLGVTLASKDLIESLQHLLLRFGILSKIGERVVKLDGKEFPAYRLTVYSQSYETFAVRIPMWGPKADGVAELAKRAAAGRNPNVGMPTFSEDLRAQLSAANKPGATRVAGDALGWNVKTHISPSMVLFHKATKRSERQHISLRGLQAYAEATGTEAQFGWIYDSEIFWDEIESITPAGMAPVYDVEVPGPHNFVANDIIVHNSSTAAMLAGTIARCSAAAGKPKRVVVVDLDTRDGQVGSLIGQYIPTAVSIRVMPRWDAPTVLANLVHDKKLGIDALLAPVRPRNADDVGPDFYRQIIQVLQTTHDVVILDCSVNYLDPLLGVGFALADEILFVTTLATTSVQGMARSLTELFADPADGGLGIPREKVGIVANQVINNVGMGKDKLLKAALGAPLVGQIPAEHDAVLIATNSNRMADLLKHPRLGPAYFKLAKTCLPGWDLAPLTGEAAVAGQQQVVAPPPNVVLGPNGVAIAQPSDKKKGFFR